MPRIAEELIQTIPGAPSPLLCQLGSPFALLHCYFVSNAFRQFFLVLLHQLEWRLCLRGPGCRLHLAFLVQSTNLGCRSHKVRTFWLGVWASPFG